MIIRCRDRRISPSAFFFYFIFPFLLPVQELVLDEGGADDHTECEWEACEGSKITL